MARHNECTLAADGWVTKYQIKVPPYLRLSRTAVDVLGRDTPVWLCWPLAAVVGLAVPSPPPAGKVSQLFAVRAKNTDYKHNLNELEYFFSCVLLLWYFKPENINN